MATKRIKFIKAWQMVPCGAEREFNTPIADELIRVGRAQEIKEAPAPVKKAKRLKKLRGNKGK